MQPIPLTLSNLVDVQSQDANPVFTADISNGKASSSRAEPLHISEAKVPVLSQVRAVRHCFSVFFHRIDQVVPSYCRCRDWEPITVRTVNDVTTRVNCHAHSERGSGYGYQLALLVWPY